LAEVEAAISQFNEPEIRVIAANADGDSDTDHTKSEHGLSYPVAHSVDAEIAKTLDAFTGIRQEKFIMQATEFVLRPGGEVAASMYSTTQLGRMDARDVLKFIKARM
jgi:peroxiredoxin